MKYIYDDGTDFLINGDCIDVMATMPNDYVQLTLTDIPYDGVNRESNGLRKLDKEKADVITFDLDLFLKEVYRVTQGTVVIFCGQNQISQIYNFFQSKQKEKKGTVRQLVWQKTNPSPMNGQHIYLSGIENAIWFKKRGGTFNAHCKNTVFTYSSGKSKLHPTEKHHGLLKELILDNSNIDDRVFDPCAGSGSHCLVARQLDRKFTGVELDTEYAEIASQRLKESSV